MIKIIIISLITAFAFNSCAKITANESLGKQELISNEEKQQENKLLTIVARNIAEIALTFTAFGITCFGIVYLLKSINFPQETTQNKKIPAHHCMPCCFEEHMRTIARQEIQNNIMCQELEKNLNNILSLIFKSNGVHYEH